MKRAVLSTIICFAFGACLMAQDLKLNSLEYFERQGVNVLLFRKPDHFENYDDWPFLWGQNEGTIAGNTQYIIFGSSLKNIVLGVAFKPYHVASDFLAAVCPLAYDFEGNLLGDKAATVVFDCSKLKRAVPGFCCTTRFDEGVRRCIAYLREHPELQVEDPEFDTWCDRVIAAQEEAKRLCTN